MTTLSRIGRDYLAQIVGVAASFADRLLIPGVFLRSLGVSAFSAWGVVIAAASLITILDFGITRYFTNRLVHAVNDVGGEDPARSFAEGLGVIIAVAIAAPLAILVLGASGIFATGDAAIDGQLMGLMVPITIALAVRLAVSLHLALLRAHGSFAYETVALSLADLLRTGAVVAALAAGIELVPLAWLYAAVTIATSLGFVPLTLSRYRAFRTGVRLPSSRTWRDLGQVAPGLGLSNGFNVAFVAVPTIVLAALAPGTAALAQFILIRTLGNVARQMINLFASVFGLELARRNASGDTQGYTAVFNEASRLLGVQVAAGCGALIVLGDVVFALWTGRGDLFDIRMLAAAFLPLLLVPNTLLIIEALTYHNRPWPIVYARIAQTVLTVIAFIALPIDPVQLRMILALSLGEVLGLGVPLAFALGGLAPGLTRRFALGLALRGVAVAGLAAAAIVPLRQVEWPNNWALAAVGGAWSAVVFAGLVAMFALRRGRLRELLAMLGRRGG